MSHPSTLDDYLRAQIEKAVDERIRVVMTRFLAAMAGTTQERQGVLQPTPEPEEAQDPQTSMPAAIDAILLTAGRPMKIAEIVEKLNEARLNLAGARPVNDISVRTAIDRCLKKRNRPWRKARQGKNVLLERVGASGTMPFAEGA